MISTYIQKKLNDLTRHCCKHYIKIQSVISPLEIRFHLNYNPLLYINLYAVDVMPHIGETCKHLITRIKQRLVSDNNSNII